MERIDTTELDASIEKAARMHAELQDIPERAFELKLGTGKFVTWNGKDGEDAARRYVDCHEDSSVVAWRYPKVELVIGFDARSVIG